LRPKLTVFSLKKKCNNGQNLRRDLRKKCVCARPLPGGHCRTERLTTADGCGLLTAFVLDAIVLARVLAT